MHSGPHPVCMALPFIPFPHVPVATVFGRPSSPGATNPRPPLRPCRPLPRVSLPPDQKNRKIFGTLAKTPYLCIVKIKETTPDATKQKLQILTTQTFQTAQTAQTFKLFKLSNIMKTSRNLLIAATILLLCGATSVNANAQTTSVNYNRHELGVTVGYAPTSQLFDAIGDFAAIVIEATATTIITGGTYTGYTYGEVQELPVFSLEYYYHINPVVGIGGYVSYTGSTRDLYLNWRDNSNDRNRKEYCGKARHNNISIIPTFKFDWMRREHIGLYSKAGVGITIMNETQKDDKNSKGVDQSETSVVPNIQFTLIGLEAGNQTWRGFAEIGLGEQGLANAGVRYKF